MNRIISLLILFVAMTAMAQNQKEIVIIHTNDSHSCILPMSPNLADTTKAGKGGFLRRITMLNEERKKDPELLYIDSGDFFQGSAYYTMFTGEVEIGLMNMMGLDAVTLGNHEWDSGMERLVENLRMANFPIVCSNYDFSGTELEKLVKPFTIVNKKGVKIGILAIGPKLEGLVDKKHYGDVKYLDPAESALKTATLLKEKEKCDLVICISHLGWGPDYDIAMIKQTKYIDLVLGGHTHTQFKEIRYVKDLDGKDVAVDQNGKSGINVSKMTLTLSEQ